MSTIEWIFGETKSSKAVIADALDIFATVSTKLNEGIKLAKEEKSQCVTELKEAERKFETTKRSLSAAIDTTTTSIAEAIIVKNNITKLLGK